MTQLLTSAAESACDLLDSLRALYDAAGFGLESLDGLVEVIRRIAAGDFHPAVVWPIYAADTPDKPALVQGERCFTWRQANARINRLANALHSIDVESGDRVAIMLGNSIEWFEAMAGCQKIGGAVVFVSYRYAAPELRYLLENSGATVVIFDVKYARSFVKRTRAPSRQDRGRGRNEQGAVRPYEMFLARLGGRAARGVATQWKPGDPLYFGNHGKAEGRGARPGSRPGSRRYWGLLRRVPFRRSDRHLIAAPLYHATGSGFAALHLWLGATLVHSREVRSNRFPRERSIASSITTSALVPTMLRAVRRRPRPRGRASSILSSIRISVSTGAALGEPSSAPCARLRRCPLRSLRLDRDGPRDGRRSGRQTCVPRHDRSTLSGGRRDAAR